MVFRLVAVVVLLVAPWSTGAQDSSRSGRAQSTSRLAPLDQSGQGPSSIGTQLPTSPLDSSVPLGVSPGEDWSGTGFGIPGMIPDSGGRARPGLSPLDGGSGQEFLATPTTGVETQGRGELKSRDPLAGLRKRPSELIPQKPSPQIAGTKKRSGQNRKPRADDSRGEVLDQSSDPLGDVDDVVRYYEKRLSSGSALDTRTRGMDTGVDTDSNVLLEGLPQNIHEPSYTFVPSVGLSSIGNETELLKGVMGSSSVSSIRVQDNMISNINSSSAPRATKHSSPKGIQRRLNSSYGSGNGSLRPRPSPLYCFLDSVSWHCWSHFGCVAAPDG